MFTTEEKANLAARIMIVLEQNKAGQASVREELANTLVESTIEYLTDLVISKVDTRVKPKNTTGVHQLTDAEMSAGNE